MIQSRSSSGYDRGYSSLRWWFRGMLAVVDVATWAAALILATVLRYDGAVPMASLGGLALTVLVAATLQVILGFVMKLYQGGYRLASGDEAVVVGTVALLVGGALLAMVLLVDDPRPVPLSVPFGGAVTALLAMLMVRAVLRRIRAGSTRSREGTRTLVFGAGDGGEQLIRSMVADVTNPYVPVGLLDDDIGKRHLRISGVRVLGNRRDLTRVAAERGAEALVIAVPSGEAALYRDVANQARGAGLEVKVLPGIADLLTPSRISTNDIRDIDMTDLLGRHQIDTDVDAIAGYLSGKRILVTGAGGSIGSELCRQLARFGPAELMALDRDESALHSVQLSLTGRALMDTNDVILADIRDRARMREVFDERRPEVVFHAAALKHVPMLEQYPHEGYLTNVDGTANVVQAARGCGVERFVNISTDKAANPVNVLGRCKRLAERLTAHAAGTASGTYLSVRFGNVLGSRGSVLTAFAHQIAEGGPVTVTHTAMTRYFMTISEAVELVIQAAAIGRGGEALVLDMGTPVRILDVAHQLIDLADRPVDITVTGLRPGEKVHEELFGEDEEDQRPFHPLISHVAVPALPPETMEVTDVLPASSDPASSDPASSDPAPSDPAPSDPTSSDAVATDAMATEQPTGGALTGTRPSGPVPVTDGGPRTLAGGRSSGGR